MPEGDTIHRAARTLHAALAGRTITRFESVLPALSRIDEDAPLAGRVVESVEAAGKNLLMHFSGDLHLRTHMRMHGSWHIYRPGERWRKRRADMRIVIETGEWIAVAFNVPVAEFHDGRSLALQEDLRRIGPDLIADSFDLPEALRRMRERPDEEIANVLLNQRVVAGIGNEYKSELLFIARVSPFARVRDLSDDDLTRILRHARKLMIANVAKRSGARITTFSLDPRASQYVYSRAGKPCRRCGTAIAYAKQGPDARGTWWCPKCQA
ncbi:MAG TPA: DNA-formamidopyrimidine glycosylase family protein [Thermoanaerobaculia bacterium]|nr:DNA-formamidopyrimidine glycosylase family protein [Thermoanaerobaculia bacterium]